MLELLLNDFNFKIFVHISFILIKEFYIPSFVKLNKAIKENYDSIISTKKHHISNAKAEALNDKIKQIVYRSRGFKNIEN